jgi:hypothetical protein
MAVSAAVRSSVVFLLALVTVVGCSSPEPSSMPVAAGSAGPLPDGAVMPPDHPPIGLQGGGAAPAADAPVGTVLETMNSAGYTYARLNIAGEEVWAAGPPTELVEGDRVTLAGVMGMENFPAASLNRTFDRILFVSSYVKQ